MPDFTSCVRPTLTSRKISTYTVLGFTGYVVASLVGSLLASRWELTFGVMLEVPAGLVLELTPRLKVIDGRYVASARMPFSLYVSTSIANDGPMRTLGRLDERARLVLHARGWNPARELEGNLQLRWRAQGVASAIAIPTGIVALIATNPMSLGVGIAAVAALAFDAIFLRSSLLALYATRPSSQRALPE